MNKKKILLSLLGCGVCLVSSNIMNIHPTARTTSGNDIETSLDDINWQIPGSGEYDQIEFDSMNTNRDSERPQTGVFKDNTVHKSNPDVGGYIGSSTFDLGGHEVQNAIRTDYDFNMLFYIPVDFAFYSPGIAVPENYYSTHNVGDNFETGETESYIKKEDGDWGWYGEFDQKSHFDPTYSKWVYESSPKHGLYDFNGDKWRGSSSNSSNIAIQPNTSDNHNGSDAKWNDDKFNRDLEWRYLGYSQQGVVLGNPYFPSDSDSNGAGFDRGYMGIEC
jgi:hypothetical protein